MMANVKKFPIKQNILIVSLVNEFDVIAFAGIYRSLKIHKNARITLLIRKTARSLVPFLENVDRVLFFDGNELESRVCDENFSIIEKYRFVDDYLSELTEQEFDLVVNMSQCLLSANIVNVMNSKQKVGIYIDDMHNRIISGDWNQVFFSTVNAERYNPFTFYDLLSMDYKYESKSMLPSVRIDKSIKPLSDAVSKRFDVSGKELVLISCATKFDEQSRWDLESVIKFANLMSKRGEKVVVFAGPEGKTALKYVESYVESKVVCETMSALDLTIFSQFAKVIISQTMPSLAIPAAFSVPIVYLSLREANFRENILPIEGSFVVISNDLEIDSMFLGDACELLIDGSVDRVVSGKDLIDELPIAIPDYNSLFLTTYDSDGMLVFNSVIKEPMIREDLYKEMYREMWKVVFNNKEHKAAFDDCVVSIKQNYLHNEAMSVISCAKYDVGTMGLLQEHMEDVSQILTRLTNSKSINETTFNDSMNEVEDIVKEAMTLFNRNQFLALIKFYFLIQYENANNSFDLQKRVRAILDCANRLVELFTFLRYCVNGSSEIIFDDLNMLDEVIVGDDSVVYH
jgi:ADP-heptose:LPS heptosyltransferase